MWNQSLIDGPIPVPTWSAPQPDPEGGPEVAQISGYVPGYHLNLAPELATEQVLPFVIHPATPERAFSGGETVFVKFADEAEARGVLADFWEEPTAE